MNRDPAVNGWATEKASAPTDWYSS